MVLKPLPGLPVIRDLIVDMTLFFKQYHSIKPYLINVPAPRKERLQFSSGLYECILCELLDPPARASGGTPTSSSAGLLGPTASSPTAAMTPPPSAWTASGTPTACSAATPSELRGRLPQRASTPQGHPGRSKELMIRRAIWSALLIAFVSLIPFIPGFWVR